MTTDMIRHVLTHMSHVIAALSTCSELQDCSIASLFKISRDSARVEMVPQAFLRSYLFVVHVLLYGEVYVAFVANKLWCTSFRI